MDTAPAADFIASIEGAQLQAYRDYWESLVPRNILEVFQRYLFAYASIHTTWKSNINLFNAIKECDWLHSKPLLKQKIIDSRAGLYNNRTEYIMDFANKFWDDPSYFCYTPSESWKDFRKRLNKRLIGIGRAKLAFAFEMMYPTQMQLCVTDTHVISLYACNQNTVKDKEIDVMEDHWIATCESAKVAPALARAIFWDRKQKKPDSRYWTYVLERAA